MYTFDAQLVSDLHKDVRGYRPNEYFWEEWDQCGDDTRQAMWDNLLVELDKVIILDREAKERAEIAMDQQVQNMMMLGAENKITAIRWIIEGENITKMDLAYGPEYVAFHFGLDYNNTFKADIQAAIDSMNINFDKLYEQQVA